MSRTKKGEKGPGFDYWSRKANSSGKWLDKPGKFCKMVLSRRTRRKTKNLMKLAGFC